jgi:hypothetical protein
LHDCPHVTWNIDGYLRGWFPVRNLGLALTAKDVTVRNPGDGTIEFKTPKRWEALRGPVLIVVGILAGLAGNLLGLTWP